MSSRSAAWVRRFRSVPFWAWLALGGGAAFAAAASVVGWHDAPSLLLALLLASLATYFGWLVLVAAAATPWMWLRGAALGSALALLTALEHDAVPLSMLAPFLALLVWPALAFGWARFVGTAALRVWLRSAPEGWARDPVPARAALALVAAQLGALLVLHVWPGAVHNGLASGAYALNLGSAALACLWLFLEPFAMARIRAAVVDASARGPDCAALGLALVVATVAALALGLPRRAAFEVWREPLERMAAEVPLTGELPPRRIGPWLVDSAAADARGGVYLRTWSAADWIDTVSYGFAWRPNREGSPFGAAHYWLHPVAGDWYVFAASDDWF